MSRHKYLLIKAGALRKIATAMEIEANEAKPARKPRKQRMQERADAFLQRLLAGRLKA